MKFVGSKRAVRSPEFHKRKELERKLRLFGLALLLTIVVCAPLYFLGSESLKISRINVLGNSVTSVEEISSLVKDKMRGEYLWLIPKSSTVFYPEEEIEQALLNNIPRLATAQLSRSGTSGVEVVVEEREPVALFCNDKCYFMDSSSYIYSEAPNFSDGVYIVYEDESILEPLGKTFLSKDEFERLSKFVGMIGGLSLKPERVKKVRDEYTVMITHGTQLRWRQGQDFNKILVDLNSFLSDPKTKSIDISGLEYVDLRFDNKIYYRPK